LSEAVFKLVPVLIFSSVLARNYLRFVKLVASSTNVYANFAITEVRVFALQWV